MFSVVYIFHFTFCGTCTNKVLMMFVFLKHFVRSWMQYDLSKTVWKSWSICKFSVYHSHLLLHTEIWNMRTKQRQSQIKKPHQKGTSAKFYEKEMHKCYELNLFWLFLQLHNLTLSKTGRTIEIFPIQYEEAEDHNFFLKH